MKALFPFSIPISLLVLPFLLNDTYAQVRVSRDLQFKARCDSTQPLATISFVGDILIHKALYQNVVKESQHFNQIWQPSEGLFKKADFSVGNLEGPTALGIDSSGRDRGDIGFVYDGQVYSGTNFLFNFHPRILTDLKNSGFDLLTTANNHALDRHSIGIDKSLEAAQNAKLPTVGTRVSYNNSNDLQENFSKIASINSIRVAFIGCTEMTNGREDKDEQVLLCTKNSSRLLGMIKNLSSQSDVDAVIVLAHWGTEYTHTPSNEQINYAKKYIEAGATAVVGSHPHVLQPWEKYISKDGREGLIIYSLGNFVAGQAGLARKTGNVAYLGLSKMGNQKSSIVGVGYTPTYRIEAKIYPVGSSDSSEVLKHVAGMYGEKSRVEPSEPLLKTLCAPK